MFRLITVVFLESKSKRSKKKEPKRIENRIFRTCVPYSACGTKISLSVKTTVIYNVWILQFDEEKQINVINEGWCYFHVSKSSETSDKRGQVSASIHTSLAMQI